MTRSDGSHLVLWFDDLSVGSNKTFAIIIVILKLHHLNTQKVVIFRSDLKVKIANVKLISLTLEFVVSNLVLLMTVN